MQYKLIWLDFPCVYCKADYPHSKVTGGYGGNPEVEVWDFLEASNDEQAKKKARKYDRGMAEVFALYQGDRLVCTEEDA